MKKLLILSMLILGACAEQHPFMGPRGYQGIPGIPAVGPQGETGVSGSIGHSMVASSSVPSTLVCPNGGSEVDFYIDLDDSYSVTPADSFQAASVACNGSNGADGSDGEDGEDSTVAGPAGPAGSNASASIVAYTPATTCTSIGSGVYAQNHADNITLHTLSTCTGPSKFFTLTGNQSTYFIAAKILAVYQPISNSQNQVRVVNFN